MNNKNILLTQSGRPYTQKAISKKIADFGNGKNGYKNAVHRIIEDSQNLGRNGEAFISCASGILSNFKMTRSGPFSKKENQERLLNCCWKEVGDDILRIRDSVISSGLSRDRFLLESSQQKREEIIAEIWLITKKLLPFTMSEYSYGLVGASKILFSVLPEIVLPVDNTQWKQVFKTVDLGDVIRQMTSDIQLWENVTQKKLNELDSSRRLTTLPSVYNVMAMDARPKKPI